MTYFTIRNLKVFFKDRAAVMFSLMSVFIMIGLYVLFLGDLWQTGLEDFSGVRFVMDSWVMAGVLAVTSVTTTLGALGTMVKDRESKKTKDFIVSPVKTSGIMGGYIISALIIGVIMSFITLILAEIYIVAYGGALLSAAAFFKTLGLVALSTLSGTSMVLFLVSFLKSTNAFAAASTIIGTLIGFVTGSYIPITQMPNAVQWLMKLFPPTHAATLFRQVMMEAPLNASFGGAPEYLAEFKKMLGVDLFYGSRSASPLVSVIVLLATAAVFFTLSVMNLSRKAK